MEFTPRFPHLDARELRECDSVAFSSLEHLGKAYRITRELRSGTIDCSTIVSQSHWIGAAIQTPFIAETQRSASNAQIVESTNLLPGDAIYAYARKEDSPGGRHNHVVLYLGCDESEAPWAIESREGSGAVLIKMSSVEFSGGVRRFCIEPLRVHPRGSWSQLVRQVPKLGRLGARLTAVYGIDRRHRGTDIYVSKDCAVISPLGGSIVDLRHAYDRCTYVGIWSPKESAYSVLGPVALESNIVVGEDVNRGDLLGSIFDGQCPGVCNVIPTRGHLRRLHWEMWAPNKFGVSPTPGLRCDQLPSSIDRGLMLVAQNVIYKLKCGDIGNCIPMHSCL